MIVAEARPPRPRKSERKIRVPRNAGLVRFFLHPVGKTLLVLAAGLIVAGGAVFVHYYSVYSKMIAEAAKFSPEGFMRAWFSGGEQGAEWLRDQMRGVFAQAVAARGGA